MLLIGLGIGALSSQLGSVTVSAVPAEESGEVGGLQNTATNLGASLGTALAGSVLIAVLTSSLITGIQNNPQVPDDLKSQASVELASGVPFVSDSALRQSMGDAGIDEATTDAVVDENQKARIQALDAALAVLACSPWSRCSSAVASPRCSPVAGGGRGPRERPRAATDSEESRPQPVGSSDGPQPVAGAARAALPRR